MKTKTMKITGILLTFVMLVTMLGAFSLSATAATTSGATGNCTWTFDDTTGTLTVSGEGAMGDHSSGSQPWYAYKDSIKTVIITKGVTSIYAYAFYEFPALANVKIAGSVTAIGNNAFASCENLSTVEYYGSSNPAASSNAFSGNYSLLFANVLSSYSGNVFCGIMPRATLDAANEPLPPCDHAGHTQTGCTACGATDGSIHSFVSGTCSVCGLTCAHDGTYDSATGKCGTCDELIAEASVSLNGGTEVFYKSFVSALLATKTKNENDKSFVKVYNDVDRDLYVILNRTVTLDLNGHTVRSTGDLPQLGIDRTPREYGELTIIDSGTGGKLIANTGLGNGIVVSGGSKLTVLSGSIIVSYFSPIEARDDAEIIIGGTAEIISKKSYGVDLDGDNITMSVTGGSITGGQYSISIADYTQLKSLKISGGTIKGAIHEWTYPGSSIKPVITGGSFPEGIEISGGNAYLSLLLGDGYVYYVDGVPTAVEAGVMSLEGNVTVKLCDHSGEFDTETGKCAICGKFAAVASLSVPNDLLYFATLEDAVAAAQHPSAEGSTIMLLDDVVTSVASNITSGQFMIDLNGHTVTGVALSNSGNLTITGSGNYNGDIDNRGTMVINANVGGNVEAYEGKLTVIGGTIQSLVVYGDDIVSLKGGTFNELKIIIDNMPMNNSVDLSKNLYKILAYGKLYSHSDIETARYKNDPYEGMLIDVNGNIGHAWFTSPVSVLEDDPVIPTISTQPVGADYTTIDTADALVVGATNNDDGGTLSYQWYSDTDGDAIGGTAITGATKATYTPQKVVGTTYYYCVVTNSKTGFDSQSTTSSAAKVTVTKATPTASDFTSSLPADLTYNSEGKAVTVTAKDGIVGMGEITVTYLDAELNPIVGLPTNKGAYDVYISTTEGDNYTAISELWVGNFAISPFTLDESNIVMTPEESTYDNSKQKPEISVVAFGKTLVLDEDYTLTWDKDGFFSAGTYTATITGIGNYQGSVNVSYVINPKALLDSGISLDLTEETYSGGAYYPLISVKDGDMWISPGPAGDYDVTWDKEGFVDAGTYTATVTGKNNYSGSFTRTFVIKQAELEMEFTSPISSVLPGNQIALTLNTNSDATPAWTLDNATIVSDTIIKINDGLVIGQDTVTVTVVYPETTNVKGGSKTITLKVGMADFSAEIAELSEKLAALESKYHPTADEINGIRSAIEALENGTVTDSEFATKVSEINAEITALEDACATKAELNAAVSELTTLINGKADASALSDAIENINNILGTVPAGTDVGTELASLDAAIEALNADVATNASGISANKNAILTLATTVNTLKTNLEAKDAELAGKLETLANDLSALEARVAANEQAIEELDELVAQLKEDVNANDLDINSINGTLSKINATLGEIDTTLGDLSAYESVSAVLSELSVKIANNADGIAQNVTEIGNLADTVNALAATVANGDKELAGSISELSDQLIALAATAQQNKQDIAGLKAELAMKYAELRALIESSDMDILDINDVLESINETIATLAAKTDVEAEMDVLTSLIHDLTDRIAANEKDISTNIDALSALHSTVYSLQSMVAAQNSALSQSISSLSATLSAVENRVEENKQNIAKVEMELQKAIEDLGAAIADGDKANADALAEAIRELNAAIEAARAAATEADSALKSELTARIDKADKALNAAIANVQKNLDGAKAELDKAIADGDTALDGKISDLNAALESAKAALEAADAANKTELEGKITDAKASLQAAIDQLQTELDSAKAELDKAIADLDTAVKAGDKELSDKIAALDTALANANAALEKAEADNSGLQAFTIIVCVISGIALCGSGAFAAWFVIDRKKRL